MKKTIYEVINVIASLVIIILVALVIKYNIKEREKIGKPHTDVTKLTDKLWTMNESAEGVMIGDNFNAFLKASYIAVGTPPDCQYYKIANGFPRHSYNLEAFYPDEDGIIRYHNDDGSAASNAHLVVDVSAYQTGIDWEQLKASGVDRVMIRGGYRGYSNGSIVADKMFEEHITAALDNDMKVGVYIFSQALNYDEGVEEARFLLDLIKDYKVELPLVIDTEALFVDGARTEDLDNESRTNAMVGFCETVKAAGYEPMIYSNRNWFVQNLDMSLLKDYSLWVAQYSGCPDFPYLFKGWQFTDEGKLNGLDINLDLNVWFD